MTPLRGSEYLLSRYVSLGEPETISKDGAPYTLYRFQGEHCNEIKLRSPDGNVFLYENNVLKQQWVEKEEGEFSGEFTVYVNGRVDFRQQFEDILMKKNFRRIKNHAKELRLEIVSEDTGKLLYHGKFNDRCMKDGWGIEYDKDTGNVKQEGIWSNNKLIEITRLFNGKTMTELKRNGADSLDPQKRIPTYVGEFRYDEVTETFYREGKGCLIDEKTGIAYRESVWKDGTEVSGINLNQGWYNAAPLKLLVQNKKELTEINTRLTDLVIASNCCNDIDTLDFRQFEYLKTIEIGDNCFSAVQGFKIDGLNRLKKLKIGANSFTKVKEKEWIDNYRLAEMKSYIISKSFHVVNCRFLESIEIGSYSFSDYGGEFELQNLNSLQSLKIGEVASDSWNFDINTSFLLKGL